ncbi:MAG: CARDB domain-containing protein [Dongiaceae bacterium]
MIMRKLLLSATTATVMVAAGVSTAAAGANTPTDDAMTNPTIGAAKNTQAAALGRQDVIVVEPDNLDWAHAKATTINLPFHVEAKTNANKWSIAESYIIVGVAPITSAGIVGSCCGTMDADDFSPYSYATLVDHPSSTHHVDKDAWWTVAIKPDESGIATAARNACRNLRKSLEQQGLSQDAIFGQDRNTTMSYDFRYVAAVAGTKSWGPNVYYWKQSQPSFANIDVLCQKRDGYQVSVNPNVKPSTDNLAMGFQVNQAALAITPRHYEAKCPAKLHLNPTIEATGKGTVKYRFVDQLGHYSQQFQVKFDKSDVKFLDHVIEIDNQGEPKGLGFVAPQGQGGDLGMAANTQPNLKQGYIQVEVLSPQHMLSNYADYSVKCTFGTAGNGGLVAPPPTVNPAVAGGLTAGLPDLFIDSVQASPAVPTKLFVKVTNKGATASTPTNLKAIRWVGGQATARGTLVPAIQPGQSQVVLAELGGTIDDATQLYVRVDDPNRISEQDEGNNSFKVK